MPVPTPEDLVTDHSATVDGFLHQAKNKVTRSAPYVRDARNLLAMLNTHDVLADAAEDVELQPDLLSAAGLSDKALQHIDTRQIGSMIVEALSDEAAISDNSWRNEIVYRFLLTKGDSLGGSIRNLIGIEGQETFSGALTSNLDARGVDYSVQRSRGKNRKLQSIGWEDRLLVFDKNPAYVRQNIDLILVDVAPDARPINQRLADRDRFDALAFGEIKGGIDPAGSDEHWKTARSAFDRILDAYPRRDQQKLFFVGAAIVDSVANEIVERLHNRTLSKAANLTKQSQVDELVDWLFTL